MTAKILKFNKPQLHKPARPFGKHGSALWQAVTNEYGILETYQYRGYDIVPMWQWSSWCTGIYARRADLPIVSRSTLSTMAPEKDEAVAEAKHCIDQLLARVK